MKNFDKILRLFSNSSLSSITEVKGASYSSISNTNSLISGSENLSSKYCAGFLIFAVKQGLKPLALNFASSCAKRSLLKLTVSSLSFIFEKSR